MEEEGEGTCSEEASMGVRLHGNIASWQKRLVQPEGVGEAQRRVRPASGILDLCDSLVIRQVMFFTTERLRTTTTYYYYSYCYCYCY